MAKSPDPMHRITMTRAKLDMWQEMGDAIFTTDAERDDLLREAQFAVQTLMDFRNIINGMVGLKEQPKDAARHYLDD